MKASVRFGIGAACSGAWSYGHGWLSALSTSERVQGLATIESVVAGFVTLVLLVAAMSFASEGA